MINVLGKVALKMSLLNTLDGGRAMPVDRKSEDEEAYYLTIHTPSIVFDDYEVASTIHPVPYIQVCLHVIAVNNDEEVMAHMYHRKMAVPDDGELSGMFAEPLEEDKGIRIVIPKKPKGGFEL